MARNLTYLTIDKAMSSTKDEYMVWFKPEVAIKFAPVLGSLNIVHARIFGLPYHNFLRYVRDTYGARLAGKGHKYPNFYFPNEAAAIQYATELNKRYGEIAKNLIKIENSGKII